MDDIVLFPKKSNNEQIKRMLTAYMDEISQSQQQKKKPQIPMTLKESYNMTNEYVNTVSESMNESVSKKEKKEDDINVKDSKKEHIIEDEKTEPPTMEHTFYETEIQYGKEQADNCTIL